MGDRWIAVKEESAYGTKPAWSSHKHLQFIDYGVEPNNNQTIPLESDGLMPKFGHFGPFVAGGDVKMYARADSMGHLLKWLFGGLANTQQDSSAMYLHRYTMAQGVKSFSMEVCHGLSLNAIFNLGCVVKKLTLEANMNDPAIATWNIQVRSQDLTAELTAVGTLPSVRPFHLADATITLNAVTMKAESFRVEVERSVPDDAHVSGSRLLPDISEEGFRITGEMEVRFETLAQQTAFLGGTTPADELATYAVVATFDGPPSDVEAYDSYDLVVNLPAVVLTGWRNPISARDRLKQVIGFEAIYNASNRFDLYNKDASY